MEAAVRGEQGEAQRHPLCLAQPRQQAATADAANVRRGILSYMHHHASKPLCTWTCIHKWVVHNIQLYEV